MIKQPIFRLIKLLLAIRIETKNYLILLKHILAYKNVVVRCVKVETTAKYPPLPIRLIY